MLRTSCRHAYDVADYECSLMGSLLDHPSVGAASSCFALSLTKYTAVLLQRTANPKACETGGIVPRSGKSNSEINAPSPLSLCPDDPSCLCG